MQTDSFSSAENFLFHYAEECDYEIDVGCLCWMWLEETYEVMKESDFDKLDESIRAGLSRKIANGSLWNEVVGKLNKSFKSTPFFTSFSRAMLIIRTEGHCVQVQSAMDAQQAAKDAGADVLKQWDTTLDDRTREKRGHVRRFGGGL